LYESSYMFTSMLLSTYQPFPFPMLFRSSAMIDNHIYYVLEPRIDPRRVAWRRGVDMNDRALRSIVSSLGGVANGFPREDGFDIRSVEHTSELQSPDQLVCRLLLCYHYMI